MTLQLPGAGEGRRWRLALDSALPPPFDLPAEDVSPELRAAAEAQHASLAQVGLYTLLDRACMVAESVPL